MGRSRVLRPRDPPAWKAAVLGGAAREPSPPFTVVSGLCTGRGEAHGHGDPKALTVRTCGLRGPTGPARHTPEPCGDLLRPELSLSHSLGECLSARSPWAHGDPERRHGPAQPTALGGSGQQEERPARSPQPPSPGPLGDEQERAERAVRQAHGHGARRGRAASPSGKAALTFSDRGQGGDRTLSRCLRARLEAGRLPPRGLVQMH